MKLIQKFQAIIILFISLFFFVSTAAAGAPDGPGPWADTVVSSHQGLMKNGLPVSDLQSDPEAALGIAENDTLASHSYSLGFGGSIVLGFDNWISSGSFIVESNYPDFPNEEATIDISENGTSWIRAGTIPQGGIVVLPDTIACAKFVRITDISNLDLFPDHAEGYDINGVEAIGHSCNPPGASQPNFPNTGSSGTIDAAGASSISNPVAPGLPDTGTGPPVNYNPWINPVAIILGLVIIFLGWKAYKYLSLR